MKKAIIFTSVIVVSFIAGWTLMAPSLDYFDKVRHEGAKR